MLSRVADSLYWMGRYIERAEHTSRLIAVKLESMIEQNREDAEASWARVIAALSAEAFALDPSNAAATTHAITLERDNPSSLTSSLARARDNARQVREQLSTEVWEHLNRLYLRMQPLDIDAIWVHQPALAFREILRDMHTLEGVTHTTLRHGEGWYFLELGRYIERAQLISRLLGIHFGAMDEESLLVPQASKYLDWLVLLKFCSAFEPYCKEHTAAVTAERVAGFLLFDPEFPHSVKFSVGRMHDTLSRVAPGAPPQRRARCDRLAGRLKAAMDFGQMDELMNESIAPFLGEVMKQCEHVHDAIFSAYIVYDADAVA
ncbi:MAG: alpha-E domain-containing protein [Rhizomicrobium sp.]|jgi:uncharacterized alpha-E superfamily protein